MSKTRRIELTQPSFGVMGPTCAHMKGISELYKYVMSMEITGYAQVPLRNQRKISHNFHFFNEFSRLSKKRSKAENLWPVGQENSDNFVK